MGCVLGLDFYPRPEAEKWRGWQALGAAPPESKRRRNTSLGATLCREMRGGRDGAAHPGMSPANHCPRACAKYCPPHPPAQAWPPADSPKPRFQKTLKSWGAKSQFSPSHKCPVLHHMWTEPGWPGWLVRPLGLWAGQSTRVHICAPRRALSLVPLSLPPGHLARINWTPLPGASHPQNASDWYSYYATPQWFPKVHVFLSAGGKSPARKWCLISGRPWWRSCSTFFRSH
ncbi:hypothetical protein mRhiFer1_009507 [Rhinolophus ferrumequinum]|uniref:Uncharacterized protein n=1 Tax=Rhinolophus ferrumequinum TaxID=59479 RepID=A0A7J7RAQ3_RHIFE|nr:hypothetical protein mRhiFer1_009507 [Rhinolophus ferrumequinum]